MAVAGQPDVALDAVGAFLQRQLVGGEGVLGAFGRCAPVRHHERVAAERAVARVHGRLCCRVLPFGLNRSGRFRFGFALLASVRLALAVVGHDHPALDGPVDRLVLEAAEHLQRQQQRGQRQQVGDDRRHGVVGDALRIAG